MARLHRMTRQQHLLARVDKPIYQTWISTTIGHFDVLRILRTNTNEGCQGEKMMVEEYAVITQGSIGVIDTPGDTVGFVSERIQTCRVAVFECEHATLMVHDTGQFHLPSLCDRIALYGKVNRVTYAVGTRTNDKHHDIRLLQMARTLGIPSASVRQVRILQNTFAISYSKSLGLVEAWPRLLNVRRDPNESVREAVNVLNDWFTPSNSQSAPVDVQFELGAFTSPPSPSMTLLAMLRDLRDDKEHGLLGTSALGHYGPKAGLTMPPEFQAFLVEHGLADAFYAGLPARLDGKGKAYQEEHAIFGGLPIFA